MPYRRSTTPHGRPTPEILPVFALAARRFRTRTVAEEAVDEQTAPAPDDERPRFTEPFHGRWWTRTTDLFLIREAL